MLKQTKELLAWQWKDYETFHMNRTNLIIHILTNPLFLLGNMSFLYGVVTFSVWFVIGGIVASMGVMAIQGKGHKQESKKTVPFTGVGNALARIILEQWITFPRFVISGKWYKNYISSKI